MSCVNLNNNTPLLITKNFPLCFVRNKISPELRLLLRSLDLVRREERKHNSEVSQACSLQHRSLSLLVAGGRRGEECLCLWRASWKYQSSLSALSSPFSSDQDQTGPASPGLVHCSVSQFFHLRYFSFLLCFVAALRRYYLVATIPSCSLFSLFPRRMFPFSEIPQFSVYWLYFTRREKIFLFFNFYLALSKF